MFNPLTKEVYTQTLESWSAAVFGLLTLLPRHPDIQKELALPQAPTDGAQADAAAGAAGAGGAALGRRGGGGGLLPDAGSAAGQQPQQQAREAGGTAVREPASMAAGAGGSVAEASTAGAADSGGAAGTAAEAGTAQQGGGGAEVQQQQQQQLDQQQQQPLGGMAAAVGGQGAPELPAGGAQQSRITRLLYLLTLAVIGGSRLQDAQAAPARSSLRRRLSVLHEGALARGAAVP